MPSDRAGQTSRNTTAAQRSSEQKRLGGPSFEAESTCLPPKGSGGRVGLPPETSLRLHHGSASVKPQFSPLLGSASTKCNRCVLTSFLSPSNLGSQLILCYFRQQ